MPMSAAACLPTLCSTRCCATQASSASASLNAVPVAAAGRRCRRRPSGPPSTCHGASGPTQAVALTSCPTWRSIVSLQIILANIYARSRNQEGFVGGHEEGPLVLPFRRPRSFPAYAGGLIDGLEGGTEKWKPPPRR